MTTFGAALREARASLAAAGVENPALDARLLMAAAAAIDMAALIARAGEEVPDLAEGTFASHLHRRLQGEPVARILGEKEFWGLPFEVNAATLVPRPETETLVESVLAELRRRDLPQDIEICDLGTGSGAILIALLSELPQAKGTAIDVSEAAVATARRNAERLGIAGRIRFHCGDFTVAPGRSFNVVVSNPPYIRSEDIAGLERDVRDYDPRSALDGGSDGLDLYRAILRNAERFLADGGFFAFEVGHDQSEAVAGLCRAASLRDVTLVADLAGTNRVVLAGVSDALGKRRTGEKKPLGKVGISG